MIKQLLLFAQVEALLGHQFFFFFLPIKDDFFELPGHP